MKHKLRFGSLILAIALAAMPLHAQRVQAVHGAADPTLDPVDAYVSLGSIVLLKLEDIAFRAGGPSTESPIGDLTLNVGIAYGNSTAIGDTLINFPIFLASGKTYIGAVRGVVDPSQFAPNPDGRDIALGVTQTEDARIVSNVPGAVEFLFLHTVTDAPSIDLYLNTGEQKADNIGYGDISTYASVSAGMNTFEIRDASGVNVIASFETDLSAFADSAIAILASGFMDPAANQNGQSLGLQGILPSGNTIAFNEILTGIEEGDAGIITAHQLHQNYPNPFNPGTTIEFELARQEFVTLTVYNALGETVSVVESALLAAGSHRYQWDAGNLSSGIYYYRLGAGSFSATGKMVLMR